MRARGWVLWALLLLSALVSPALAAPAMPAPTMPVPAMPVVDGGTVWAGDEGVFQQWDDGAWVYVWRPAPGEPPPQARWPERTPGTQHELAFAGRRWSGGYLVGAVPVQGGGEDIGDWILVARDEGGRWYMALFVPGAVLDARADFVVQALKGMSLEGE